MKLQKFDHINNASYVRLGKFICASLILMYATVPVAVDMLGLYEAKYAMENFWFSLSLLFFLFALPLSQITLSHPFSFTERRNFGLTLVIFFISVYIFHLFPWHDDRESIGSTFAAFMRALWFVTAISYINSTERSRTFVAIATIVLMYIDQSRTYFLLLLIIISSRSEHKKLALIIGLLVGTVLGAVRSADSGGGMDLILYGIVGEGYNATRPVGQIYESSGISIDKIAHIASTFLQPITLPFDVIMFKAYGGEYVLQDFYLSSIVESSLGEIFNPMGGWYITGDYIYYGNFGLLLMGVNFYITWRLSRLLLDTKSFPYGVFFIFIAIKSNPFVYWKFVYYILCVSLFYKFLNYLLSYFTTSRKFILSNSAVRQ